MAFTRLIGFGIYCLVGFCLSANVVAAKWQLSEPKNVAIDTSLVGVSGLSGITYVGESTTALHHNFLAVQDNGGKLVSIQVVLSPTGELLSASSITSLSLSASLDFEGAAYTDNSRNSVFLVEEGSPDLREFDLTSGAQLQSLSLPSVYANRRANYGFESLARSPNGATMWTGNEEALTVDGPRATSTSGTIVRLQRMNVTENTVTTAEQYAYRVEPIHMPGISNQRRSGLSDLVALPDGTLLALERSFEVGLASPWAYKSSVYEIDFTNASDISLLPLDAGLIGNSYTAVSKELRWAGSAAGSSGQNLEGLTLGPRLANGNWLLVGVVDNNAGADPLSGNTLVTFELSAIPSADFDEDGDVDGRDFLNWQRGFGTTIGATHSHGDADRDGDVDDNDLELWSTNYSVPPVAAQSVPEPAFAGALFAGMLSFAMAGVRRHIVSMA